MRGGVGVHCACSPRAGQAQRHRRRCRLRRV